MRWEQPNDGRKAPESDLAGQPSQPEFGCEAAMSENRCDVLEGLRYRLNFLEQADGQQCSTPEVLRSIFQLSPCRPDHGNRVNPHACHLGSLYYFVPGQYRIDVGPAVTSRAGGREGRPPLPIRAKQDKRRAERRTKIDHGALRASFASTGLVPCHARRRQGGPNVPFQNSGTRDGSCRFWVNRQLN
jgi:hypothetical protein